MDFEDFEPRTHELLANQYPLFELTPQVNPLGVSDRLEAYFKGDFAALNDIPVSPGGTDFQQEVWFNLRSILPGTTITYGGLTDRLRKPKSARAVGMTNSLNPIAIVLACHRVIGANGKLTGYSGDSIVSGDYCIMKVGGRKRFSLRCYLLDLSPVTMNNFSTIRFSLNHLGW